MIFDSVEKFLEFSGSHWYQPDRSDERARKSYVIVATSGAFDILHKGHLKLLNTARRLGDCLVVLLNSDESISEYKSPFRPVKDWDTRAKILNELQSVDYVIKLEDRTPTAAIMKLKPDLWVKGNRPASEMVELEACFEVGCDIVVLWNCEPGSSSSALIGKAAQVYQDEQKKPAPSSGVGQVNDGV